MLKTSLNIPVRIAALIIIMFISNAGLALGTNTTAVAIGGIPVIHLISAAIIAVAIPRGISKLRGHNPFLMPIRIILFLFAVSAVLSVYEFIFSYSVPLKDMAYNIFKMCNVYLIFFPIIVFIRNEKELIVFLKGATILALIAACAVAYQFIFNVDLPGSVVTVTTTVTRSYRIMYPAVGLILGGYVFLLSLILNGAIQKKRSFFIGLAGFLGVCSILSMHRNLLVITFVITLWMLLFAAGKKHQYMKSLFKGVAVVMIFIAMFVIIRKISPAAHLDLEGSYYQTVNELRYGKSSLDLRFDLLSNVFKDVLANYPFLGKGFNYILGDFDYDVRIMNSPTNDNSIANILLCFGFTGMCAFVLLFYHLFRSSLRLTHKENLYVRALVYGCMAINLIVIMLTSVSDVIMGNTWTAVMVFSWAILYLIYQFSLDEKKILWSEHKEPIGIMTNKLRLNQIMN